jgi:uncharacterized membrane protein
MTRTEFMTRLRRGLSGLSPAVIAEAAADYEAHFDEAIAAGRTEQEAAGALGDPVRLGRELRAELGLKRWDDSKSPSSALSAVLALLGLGALDILILLPILMSVLSALISLFLAVVVVIIAGGGVLVAGPFIHDFQTPWLPVFGGLAMVTGGTAVGAILTLFTIGLINALVWFGRLHYRLIKPAIEAQG